MDFKDFSISSMCVLDKEQRFSFLFFGAGFNFLGETFSAGNCH
jgi:hypothetical protein